MENQTNFDQSAKSANDQPLKTSHWWVWVIAMLVVVAGVAAAFIYCQPNKTNMTNKTNTSNLTETSKTSSDKTSGKQVTIPAKILANKFGWLSADPRDASMVNENGGAWARPHPGGFLWDQMQQAKDKDYDFSITDSDVKGYGDKEIGILATVWPFAEWDQLNRTDAKACEVSSNDEFLPTGREEKMEKFGDMDYLPLHRCNPSDWSAYTKWVSTLVERYDGDGMSDMSGLKIPIKYWEIMNEPDLDTGPDGRLDFYKEDATAYVKLLVETSKAIRAADPEAKILIAGAAGGDERFLSFYRQVFSNKEAVESFDIGNVHCISGDDIASFNVDPYKNFLANLGISKPIWVTEAEAKISNNTDENATQVYNSTKKALELGAQRIFYTMSDFINQPGSGDMRFPPHNPITINPELKGKSATEAYQVITSQ